MKNPGFGLITACIAAGIVVSQMSSNAEMAPRGTVQRASAQAVTRSGPIIMNGVKVGDAQFVVVNRDTVYVAIDDVMRLLCARPPDVYSRVAVFEWPSKQETI